MHTSWIFQVSITLVLHLMFFYLSPFDVGDDSRMNPFEERGNDENYKEFKDPLHVLVRPIAKARSKKHLMG